MPLVLHVPTTREDRGVKATTFELTRGAHVTRTEAIAESIARHTGDDLVQHIASFLRPRERQLLWQTAVTFDHTALMEMDKTWLSAIAAAVSPPRPRLPTAPKAVPDGQLQMALPQTVDCSNLQIITLTNAGVDGPVLAYDRHNTCHASFMTAAPGPMPSALVCPAQVLFQNVGVEATVEQLLRTLQFDGDTAEPVSVPQFIGAPALLFPAMIMIVTRHTRMPRWQAHFREAGHQITTLCPGDPWPTSSASGIFIVDLQCLVDSKRTHTAGWVILDNAAEVLPPPTFNKPGNAITDTHVRLSSQRIRPTATMKAVLRLVSTACHTVFVVRRSAYSVPTALPDDGLFQVRTALLAMAATGRMQLGTTNLCMASEYNLTVSIPASVVDVLMAKHTTVVTANITPSHLHTVIVDPDPILADLYYDEQCRAYSNMYSRKASQYSQLDIIVDGDDTIPSIDFIRRSIRGTGDHHVLVITPTTESHSHIASSRLAAIVKTGLYDVCEYLGKNSNKANRRYYQQWYHKSLPAIAIALDDIDTFDLATAKRVVIIGRVGARQVAYIKSQVSCEILLIQV